LGDAHKRQDYDQQLRSRPTAARCERQRRTAAAQDHYRASRQTGRDADEQLAQWLHKVYQPVNRLLCQILNSLEEQIDQLAADPFDDELLEEFQAYVKTCRDWLRQAQIAFRSMPNPPSVAGAATHLYYCLNQVGDALDELDYFPLNYDERCLHTGQELFRIAAGLHCEAQVSMEAIA
jgi:molecular chaperone DnaJ